MITEDPAVLTVFHRVDDPWSYLLLQVLPSLKEQYNVRFRFVTVPMPGPDYVPRPDALMANGMRDAADITRYCALDFPENARRPDPDDVALAHRLLLAQSDQDSYLATALRLGASLFSGDRSAFDACFKNVALPTSEEAEHALKDNAGYQRQRGHYNSAMILFEGGWYWGVDRLHHLEQVLIALGYRKPTGVPGVLAVRLPCPTGPRVSPDTDKDGEAVLRFYCSFRSPYAYIAAPRAFALAERYRVRVEPRLIIPMKMAGFAVPRIKADYFRLDCAREGLRHAVPFGHFTDPFGDGLRRAMAIYPHAQACGLGNAYILSVMRGVWSDGLDTARDEDLARMCARAGLDRDAAMACADPRADLSWADRHRGELEEYDQYAAPVFVIGDYMTWGQDRIWVLERVLDASVGPR